MEKYVSVKCIIKSSYRVQGDNDIGITVSIVFS